MAIMGDKKRASVEAVLGSSEEGVGSILYPFLLVVHLLEW